MHSTSSVMCFFNSVATFSGMLMARLRSPGPRERGRHWIGLPQSDPNDSQSCPLDASKTPTHSYSHVFGLRRERRSAHECLLTEVACAQQGGSHDDPAAEGRRG